MSEDRNEELMTLLRGFDKAVTCNPEEVSKRNQILYLPNISDSTFQQLFESIRNHLYSETPVHHIEPPCVIFGDIHGHFMDIIRIIKRFGHPDDKKFVFLGDLIDRGEFNIETITYIFLLKYFYKENVIILRGNHEFPSVFNAHGFSQDAREYSISQESVMSMTKTLEYLPFACTIGCKYICVHGGLGPSVTYEGIKAIKLPCETFDGSDIVQDIVWSDPMTDADGFKKSPRGKGHLFGKDAVNEFLDKSGFSCLIRAHEKPMNGVKSLFDGKLLTVFSASNYCGEYGNCGAAIVIDKDLNNEIVKFEPLTYLLRCHTLKVDDIVPKKAESDPLLKFKRSLQKDQSVNRTRRPSDPFSWEQSSKNIPSIILNRLKSKQRGTPGIPPTIKHSSERLRREQLGNQNKDSPK